MVILPADVTLLASGINYRPPNSSAKILEAGASSGHPDQSRKVSYWFI
jgi:hypothetical protein